MPMHGLVKMPYRRRSEHEDDDDTDDDATTTTNPEAPTEAADPPNAPSPTITATSSSVHGDFNPGKFSNRPSRPPLTEYPTNDFYLGKSRYATTSTLITRTKTGPYGESQLGSVPTSSRAMLGTDEDSLPSSSPADHGHENPGGPNGDDRVDGGAMYAAAAIAPIVLLAIIGALVFCCLRKRKRQRVEMASAQEKVQELKMHCQPQSSARAYMAPSLASPQYAATDSHLLPLPLPLPPPRAPGPHPIILGPIPSGSNGAYFTGMDTSDVISMTSANNIGPSPPNPFSDSDSLAEPPPPPYRPRSVAPPSFTNSSRHSSFRASASPPATSRTHLMERSPFDDPGDDDDISDISGPTAGQHHDAMSAVSDLSYQRDPVVNRAPL